MGLLAALLAALPVGAQTVGTITLKGDVDDKPVTHFSDKDGFNVVTIEVKDPDLSPVRSATASFAALSMEADGRTVLPTEDFPL